MKEKFPNIAPVLVVTAIIVATFGGCFLTVFYGYRPGVLELTEASGLLGICAATAILAICRFIVQAALILLGALWLAYIGWLVASNRTRDIDH